MGSPEPELQLNLSISRLDERQETWQISPLELSPNRSTRVYFDSDVNAVVVISPMREASGDQGPTDDVTPATQDVDTGQLGHHKINLDNIHTDADRQKTIMLLRGLPCPMATKKTLLNRIMSQKKASGSLSGYALMKDTKKKRMQQFKNFWEDFCYTVALWGGNIRKIEGIHGSGVASYFLFLRWLFGLNVLLFLLMFGFVTLPVAIIGEESLATSSVSSYQLAYQCSNNYTVAKGSGVKLLLEWFQGSGWMEETLLFYGYYPVALKETYNMPFAYIMTSVVVLVASLFLMARYTSNSLKDALLTSSDTKFEYCNSVFAAWDFSLTDPDAAELKASGIAYEVKSDMLEQELVRKRIARLEKCSSATWLYTVRLLVNTVIVTSLGGAAYLIYFTTIFSSEYSSENADDTGNDGYLLLLVQYLPSLTITFCNAALPMMFEILASFEDYSQAFVIKITLIRTVFLRLASMIVLVISLYSEISCSSQNSCRATIEPTCTNIQCWETYVGQQFYKLVVTDFLVQVIKVFLVEFPRSQSAKRCNCGLFQKIGPPTFNIPSNVLDLVYGQCLVWLGFLFTPLLPGMVMVKLLVIFYAKNFSVVHCCPPAERPYKASHINTFFMVILLMAYFMCALPIIYTIFAIPPSRSCGSFRVKDYMEDAIRHTVEAWPSPLGKSYSFLTSTAVTGTVIVLLIMTIYYLRTMGQAHKAKAEQFKKQLIMEGRDKQFLLTKLQEIYQGNNKSSVKDTKRKPPPNDSVQTIDEKGQNAIDW